MFLLFEFIIFFLLFPEKQIIYVICIYLHIKLVSNTILYHMMFVSFNSNMTDATCEAESACL